jgi:hypothetical protein
MLTAYLPYFQLDDRYLQGDERRRNVKCCVPNAPRMLRHARDKATAVDGGVKASGFRARNPS